MKVLSNPSLFWRRYGFESLTTKDLYRKVLLPIMLMFFCIVLFGTSVNELASSSFVYILLEVFVNSLMLYATYFVLIFLVKKISVFFAETTGLKVAVFVIVSMSPYLMIYALTAIFPSLFFFWILSLYMLYVMYHGAIDFLNVGTDNVMIFLILVVVTIVVTLLISSSIGGFLIGLF